MPSYVRAGSESAQEFGRYRQDNALRLHASLGFCRLVDGDEFVALGFQVVDDGGQRVHVYQPKPI